jgi:hypothetical protein
MKVEKSRTVTNLRHKSAKTIRKLFGFGSNSVRGSSQQSALSNQARTEG